MMSKCTVSPRIAPARFASRPAAWHRAVISSCVQSMRADRRLAGAERRPRRARPRRRARRAACRSPATVPGRSSSEARVADQFAPLGVVGVRQQHLDRHLHEFRVAVELVAVGESELGRLDLQMDEIGAGGIERVEVVALEQRELSAASPGPGSTAPASSPCSGRSRSVSGASMLACQRAMSWPVSTPRWRSPRGVHHLLRAAERSIASATKPCDQVLRARSICFAVAAGAFRLAQNARVGVGERAHC